MLGLSEELKVSHIFLVLPLNYNPSTKNDLSCQYSRRPNLKNQKIPFASVLTLLLIKWLGHRKNQDERSFNRPILHPR